MGPTLPLMKIPPSLAFCLSIFLGLLAVYFLRVRFFHSNPLPAKSFADAMEMFDSLRAQEKNIPLRPEGESRLLHHGYKTERVFVLLHGLTNCPEQFVPFAKILHATGANVVIPRAKYAGYADRLNNLQGLQSGQDLIDQAAIGLNIGSGLGDHVSLVGLSGSAVAGLWMAQHREGISQMILIAPFFSLDGVPASVIDFMAAIFARIPNFYQWWDSTKKENLPGPNYAYPRFGTFCMADTILLSRDVRRNLTSKPLKTDSLTFLITASDKAANNTLTKEMATTLANTNQTPVLLYEFPESARIPHDMIDPNQPEANIAASYPKLLELLQVKNPANP
jgi:pimeloyl-ACP methyl ester carboxylesterase